jgi:hypothetical protein
MTGEPSGSARFLKESLHNLRFVREVFVENFNCEQAAVPSTAGKEHLIPPPPIRRRSPYLPPRKSERASSG